MMRAFKLTIGIAIVLPISSCAIYHHYSSYYGQVIDAETEKPIEGAVVLVCFNTWAYGSPGGRVGYFLDAQEAVTDKKGEFKIPPLNAFAFRPFSTFEGEPEFFVFKPAHICFTDGLFEDQYNWIKLRELKTREERIANHCFPTIVPKRKMKKFINVQNKERINLGLQPLQID